MYTEHEFSCAIHKADSFSSKRARCEQPFDGSEIAVRAFAVLIAKTCVCCLLIRAKEQAIMCVTSLG